MVITLPINENEWIETSRFSIGRFKHAKFNPVQSAFFKIYDKKGNKIIESSTSSGKTVIAEMSIFNCLNNGKKAIFIAPLKALADEKYNEWINSNHDFSKFKISIVTGDYLPSENRQKVLFQCLNSDIMIFTPEMFDSLLRKKTPEIYKWMNTVGTVVIDEFHLLTMPWRGSTLESSLIKCSDFPHLEFVLLSATMSNVDELAEWVSNITGQNTYLIKSNWRPVKLNIHYIPYVNKGTYWQKMENLAKVIFSILDDAPADKFLIFVHSKNIGKFLQKKLNEEEYGEIPFHNADLELNEKQKIVNDFAYSNDRIIIATSTLAWGVNLPARRVIIAGVERGMEEVHPIDIKQMVGRAGRYGIDPEGDAYILYPWTKPKYKGLLEKPENFVVESRLLYPDEIAFHVVSEIEKGKTTLDDLKKWYEKSFAYYQTNSLLPLQEAIDDLISWGVIESQNDFLKLNPTGKIAAWFYYSPYMVAKLLNNFSVISSNPNDLEICNAIGTALPDYPTSKNLLPEAQEIFGSMIPTQKLANAFAIWLLINGLSGRSGDLYSLIKTIQADSERLCAVLKALEGFYKVNCHSSELLYRFKYGAPAEFVPLLQIKGIGLARAEKLYNAGIKNKNDLLTKMAIAKKILGEKTYHSVVNNLKTSKFTSNANIFA